MIARSAVDRQRSTIASPSSVVELEAIDHHHRFDGDIESAAAASEHLLNVCVTEEEPPGELVVLLVEGAAGDEDSDAHLCSFLPEVARHGEAAPPTDGFEIPLPDLSRLWRAPGLRSAAAAGLCRNNSIRLNSLPRRALADGRRSAPCLPRQEPGGFTNGFCDICSSDRRPRDLLRSPPRRPQASERLGVRASLARRRSHGIRRPKKTG